MGLSIALATSVTVSGASAASASLARPAAPQATAARQSAVPHLSAASDLVLSGAGDAAGYHLLAADARSSTAWQEVATILPPVNPSSSWIGRQCLTQDGRFAVVTTAPSLASAHPDLVAHGGFAYSVEIATGHVIPLLSGVTLAYFSPACGPGHLAALTSYTTADDAPTTVAIVDVATGRQTALVTSPDEVTSAVPLSSVTAAAVDGNTLVQLAPGTARRLAVIPGLGFDVRPNAVGGVDLLSADQAGNSSQVLRWEPSRGLRALASVARTGTDLFTARDGSTVVVGSPGAPSSANVRWLAAPAVASVKGVSLDADAQLTAVPGSASLALVSSTGRRASLGPPAAGASPASAAIPAPITASVDPRRSATASTTANTTAPTCAVARLDVHRQVVQPSSPQINWAIEMATRNLLTHSRTGDPSWRLSPYTPSTDFHLGVTVPREVMSGIIAAESNWDQATFHAAVGVPGNPLIANYYGLSADGSSRDYANADCGYGLTQQTDGMHVGDTQFSANTQQAVGLDYAENVAAGTSTLVSKWNQLAALGIIANNGNPSYIENWYFAIWAYNTGIHPNDGTGESGLGWSNNPINPVYSAGRLPYLDNSYADAATPSNWPYQEQVMGWAEHPLLRGGQAYPPAQKKLALPPHSQFCNSQNNCTPGTSSDGTSVTYTGNTLNDPYAHWAANQWVGATVTTVGTSVSDVVVGNTVNTLTIKNGWSSLPASGTGYAVTFAAPCKLGNYHCWWHASATWSSGCSACTAGQWHLSSTAPEPPTPANPTPGVCNLAGSPAPSTSAVVVDDESDGTAADLHVSLNNGCSGTRNWTNSGRISMSYGAVGIVDFHQLGVGFDGHTWFSHQVDPSNAGATATVTWTPTLSQAAGYVVWAFVPSAAATATNALYTVSDGQGIQVQVTVNQNSFSNAWVPLGQYRLHAGASVTLSNNEGASGNDLAFDAIAFDPVTPLNPAYVAMGDSYSSGTGAGSYDAVSNQNHCYRSIFSYPTILDSTLSTTYAKNSAFVACSGAVTANLSTSGFKGEEAQYVWLTPSTRYVTLTIGGNDVNFAPILQSCFFGTGCGAAAFPNEANQIQAMKATLRSVYQAIHAAAANAAIVPLTYPQIFPSTGCAAGDVGSMSDSDLQWIRSTWSSFNSVIKQAASGLTYVHVLDEENAFVGHDVCQTGGNWANRWELFPTDASFHPNIAGDKQLAHDLEAYLKWS